MNLATLPITYAGVHPSVQGTINGSPVTMSLDTGAQQTVLSRQFAERLGLTLSHSNRVVLCFSGTSAEYRTRVDNMSIGPTHGDHLNLMVVWETAYLQSGASVGADFLLQRDVEISLASRELKFFEPLESMACREVFLAYWDANAAVVDFAPGSSIDHRPTFIVEVNGQKLRAIIDSGAQMSMIDLAAARRAGITPQTPGTVAARSLGGVGTHAIASWIAPVDSLVIGTETIRNTSIVISDLWSSALADSNKMRTAAFLREQPEIFLGADFLQAHRVLIALSQRRIYLSYLGGDVFRAPTAEGKKPEPPGSIP